MKPNKVQKFADLCVKCESDFFAMYKMLNRFHVGGTQDHMLVYYW